MTRRTWPRRTTKWKWCKSLRQPKKCRGPFFNLPGLDGRILTLFSFLAIIVRGGAESVESIVGFDDNADSAGSTSKGGTPMKRMNTGLLALLALTLFFVPAGPALADEVKGKINSVDPDKNQFVVLDEGGKNWTI